MNNLTLERVRNNLSSFGLKGILTVLDERIEQSQKESPSYTEFLDNLLEEELSSRQSRRTQTLLKFAGGNVLKYLEKENGVRYPIGIKEVNKGKIP